jgi:hypothetical protein
MSIANPQILSRPPPVRLLHVSISLKDANDFVAAFHRHHKPVVGHKFSIAALHDGNIVGVVIVGRLIARMRDDGLHWR